MRIQTRNFGPVTITATVSGVPNGIVRFVTDEGQTEQIILPATGQGIYTWVTTAQLAAYVRAEVRHPKSDGASGSGNAQGPSSSLVRRRR